MDEFRELTPMPCLLGSALEMNGNSQFSSAGYWGYFSHSFLRLGLS